MENLTSTDLTRIRVFYNSREPEHNQIKAMLEGIQIPYSMLPTSGPYTLHLIHGESPNIGMATGPTQIRSTLKSLLDRVEVPQN
jgi:hypothetical protein